MFPEAGVHVPRRLGCEGWALDSRKPSWSRASHSLAADPSANVLIGLMRTFHNHPSVTF